MQYRAENSPFILNISISSVINLQNIMQLIYEKKNIGLANSIQNYTIEIRNQQNNTIIPPDQWNIKYGFDYDCIYITYLRNEAIPRQ